MKERMIGRSFGGASVGWRWLGLLAAVVLWGPSTALAQSSCASLASKPLFALSPELAVDLCDPDKPRDQLQLARAAAQANNSDQLQRFGQPLFDENRADALLLLGTVAEEGIGQARDSNEALFVYRAAASDGLPGGAAGFARMALGTDELPRLRPQAVEAMRLAVIRGDYTAAAPLAAVYLSGRYVTRSANEALRLIQQGVRNQDPDSLYTLGSWHLNGRVVTASRAEALNYFRRAAVMGEPRSLFALGFYDSDANAEVAARDMIDGYVRTLGPRDRNALFRRMRRVQSEATRLAVQRILNDAGLDTGGLDGSLGRRTQQALEAYRAERYSWPE